MAVSLEKNDLDKEWRDAEKALEAKRRAKREQLYLEAGIQAIIVVDTLNQMPTPTKEEAELKWQSLGRYKQGKYLHLSALYSPIADV